MLKYFLIIILFLFFASFVFAQNANFEWVKVFKSNPITGTQEIKSMAVDANGNIYTIGTFSLTVDFNSGPAIYNLSAVHTDMFILKIDASGNFLWVKQIVSDGIIPASICIDPSGNICMTGQFHTQTDFDPGSAITTLNTSAGFNNAFILKLDSNGNFSWVKSLLNVDGFDNEGLALKTDQSGNIYVMGFFKGMVDFDPGAGSFVLTNAGTGALFILKLDLSGNFARAKQVNNVSPFAVSTDNNGSVCVTGYFLVETDFDPGPAVRNLTPAGQSDIFILKLDTDGDFSWARSAGGLSTDRGSSVTNDYLGNIYITGLFSDIVDFDPGPAVFNLTASGSNAAFILKLDAQGNFIWVKSMGGGIQTVGNSIITDNQKNIYVTGFFWGTADFDPGPGVFELIAGSTYNAYILKLDPTGNFVWAKQFYGGLNNGLSIALDSLRNVYTAGRYFQIVDFDPGPLMYNLTSGANPNAFIHKLNQPCIANTFFTMNVNTCDNYTLNEEVFTMSGTYTQVIASATGCDSTITLHLMIGERSTAVDTAICEGQVYFAGGNNQTTAGIYLDTLHTSAGCDSIVTTNLLVNTKPMPDLGLDRKLCADAAVVISPGSFTGYLWQDMSTGTTFSLNSSGTYWVTVTNANNCTATDSLKILHIDNLPKNFLPADHQICLRASFNITIPGYQNYLWSTGSSSNDILIQNTGTYYLTVTDYNNCVGKDSIIITQKNNCIPISIPNAYTPNKDGTNDIFRPTITQDITDYSFTIFNRYGQKIFETKTYPAGWNGKYKGKDQPAGCYVYLIHYRTLNGLLMEEKGTVTLFR